MTSFHYLHHSLRDFSNSCTLDMRRAYRIIAHGGLPETPYANAIVVIDHLITVDVGLVWAFDFETHILGLDLGQLGQLGVYVVQVQKSNLLVEDLG